MVDIEYHLGKRIREVMKQKGVSVTALAKAINCERTTIYNIFRRKSLNIEQLISISIALNHNFITEINFKIPEKKIDN